MESRDSMAGKDARILRSNGKGKESVKFTTKLSASATGLLQGALGSPNVHDLQHAMDSEGKLPANSSLPTPLHWLQDLPVRSNASKSVRLSGSALPCLRSSPTLDRGDVEFEEFMESSGSSTPDFTLHEPEPTFRNSQQTFDSLDSTSGLHAATALAQPIETSPIPGVSAFEYHLDRSTNNSAGPESSPSRLFNQATDELDDIIVGRAGSDGHAHTRLKMIFGHITDSAHTSVSYEDSALARTALQLSHRAALESRLQAFRDDVGHNPMSATVSQHVINRRDTPARYQPFAHDSQAAQDTQNKRDRYQEPEDEQPVPEFHCPWIRCHQRFNDMVDLFSNGDGALRHRCVHDNCRAQFSTHQQWAEHIARPHHDLVARNLPMTLVSSGGSIRAVAATNPEETAAMAMRIRNPSPQPQVG